MENYSLNVESNNIGGYFSSEQIDLLRIIQCNNISELYNFIEECDQIKHLFNEQELKYLNDLDIESAKRKVFETYQNTMVLHDSDSLTDIENKLKNIGIKDEHISQIKQFLGSRDIPAIRKIIETYYPDKATEMLTLSHYFVSQERDQIKSSNMYDEFVTLNTNLPSFNTILIGSGKIYSVINDFYNSDEPKYRFDFYKAKRDLDFAFTNKKQVRFHSLLVKEDSHLFDGKSKKEIIAIMSDYVKHTIDFVNDYNNTKKINGQPVINAIDLFNEIVSFDKNEQGQYYNIWESKYGITLQELMPIFDYAKEHKPDGVSYLYNEPFLENDERRKKVFETLQTITSLSPGLIDTLGSQMHITITEDLGKIQRCFADFKRLQEMTGMKIQITEFDMSLGSREILHVFGENADYTLSQIYDIKRKQIENISKIINDSGVNLSGVSYWSLTDGIDCNLERIRTNLLEQGIITNINQIPTACGGLIPTHKTLLKQMQQTNNNDNEVIESLQKLKQLSRLSTRQMLELYSNNPKYSGVMESIQKQQFELLQQVKQEREQMEPRLIEYLKKSFPALSEKTISQLATEQFYRMSISKFLKPVISQVESEYGAIIPKDKMEKFRGLADFKNIRLNLNGTNAEADSKNGQLIFNPNETLGTTIEEKIVMSMGVSIHEAFHLLVNMNKSQEQAMEDSERLKYIVSTSEGDKEVHFAPGKYGQVLNEGFVEKMSSEFAQRNGFYCMINPRYIPYVDVCSKIMEYDKSISPEVLFTKNSDDIREKMESEIRTKYEETERIVVINHFSVKEADKDSSLKNITSDNVKESWMEKNGADLPKIKNDMFKGTLEVRREVKKENNNSEVHQNQEKKSGKITPVISVKKGPEAKSVSFARRSDSEIQTASQIKQKNTIKHNETMAKKTKDKSKTLVKKQSNPSNSPSSGFVDTLILTLITGFVAGTIFMIVYSLLK